MKESGANAQMISKLFFHLLPIQILLCLVGAVNGIVSSLFASNYVGTDAMSAISLYAPVTQFVGAVSTMLVGGSQILCGTYMGKNQVDRTQAVFSLDVLICTLLSLLLSALLFLAAMTNLTRFAAPESAVRQALNQYLLGQALGILPMMLGQQLSAFLSLENQTRRSFTASLVFIAVNVVLNFLFVAVLRMNAFGLALASSLGLWVFFLIQALYYFRGKSLLRLKLRGLSFRSAGEILKIGFPGAISNGYQTLRRILVNMLIVQYVGSIGLSAFTASDTLLGIVWAIPAGIVAVSRMLMSISIGEEDRQTLADIMRVVLYKCVPMMTAIAALLILCAVPLTRLFYRDAANPVYGMTVWSFRILPLCMPLSVICMNFVCYGQASGKQLLVHLLSILDGVVCVVAFSAMLVPVIGLNGVFLANVLNGVVTTFVCFGYSCLVKKHVPRNMDDLMVIPEAFGARPEDRMDLSLKSMDQVVAVSRRVQDFCRAKGVDSRRAYLAGLAMEEMAGNVIDHGFSKDRKSHAVDVRVVCKGEDLILRIKDDCVPFDPAERRNLADPADPARNIGIRIIYSMARDIRYQNILGLNVLTIRV